MRITPIIAIVLLAGCSSTTETAPTTVATTTPPPTTVATTTPAAPSTTAAVTMSRDTYIAVDNCIDSLSLLTNLDRQDGRPISIDEEKAACDAAIDQLEADRLGDTPLAEALMFRGLDASLLALKILQGTATEADTKEFDGQYVETSTKLRELLDELYAA
jgi:hypothetical protein